MSRRSFHFFLRSLFALWIGVSGFQLLAQTAPADSPQLSAPQPPAANDAAAHPAVSADSDTKLGIGDLVDVSVYNVPDLSTKTRINNSGDLYLPLVDYVHVADLTLEEAQSLIQKRLEDGGFVRNPHVSIFVAEAASQAITVLGEVARPGPYAAIGERRLFDIISLAGGLTDKAGRNVTIEHRGNPPQKEVVQLSSNLADDTEHNIDVFPGDTIIVSRAGIIYVVGDVHRPSGFRVEDNTLSVLKALALAGGGTRTASLNKARILRETANGIQEIPVKLKQVLYAKIPDVPLVKGDVLFVPGSGVKAAAYRTAEAAFSLSTTLAVIGVQTF